eukprot:403373759
MMDKIQGSKAVIYSRQKVPLMFCPDAKLGSYFPTIYMLFQFQESGLLKCFLKTGVESYIFNGADLMWPGIKAFGEEQFKVNDIVVIYAKNQHSLAQVGDEAYIPVAVGKMLANQIPDNLKGKAIQVEHYLYDELWNMGPKKIPIEVKINRDGENANDSSQADTQQETQSKIEEVKNDQAQLNNLNQVEEEKKSYEADENGNTLQNDQNEEEKNTTTVQSDQAVPEEEGLEAKIPAEEMDPRIVEALFRAIFEDFQDSEMPMEPSDLQKDYLCLYSDINYKLDFRCSSFKRIGKFLEIMHKRGILDYSEPKGINHKVITRIHRANEELKSFEPKYSLRKSKKVVLAPQNQDAKGVRYPKVEISEVFQLNKNLNCVLQNVKNMNKSQKYFNLKELRDLLTDYVKENNLENFATKGSVKLDPILNQIISNRKVINSQNEVSKDNLYKAILDHIIDCYQVVQIDEQEIIKDRVKFFRGEIPMVKVQAKRVQNKKQTVITGLELYQIDYDELVQYLQNKCAGSVTTQETESSIASGAKNPKQAVLVQGNHLDLISKDILPKRYFVPEKYIIKVDDIKGKGKKGKK